MAKRRKPKEELQPLLIFDDRNEPPDKLWRPIATLPAADYYHWSKSVLVCQFVEGDRRPTLMIASYDFQRSRWYTAMGEVKNVTYWQPLPDFPKEYRT